MSDASDLARYPRPNVAVDLALLTALPPSDGEAVGRLAVLLQKQESGGAGWALPGRFLRQRQTVEEAVADVLTKKVGLTTRPSCPVLLGVFDDPERDPRGWTLSLAHALALPQSQLARARGELVVLDLSGAPEDDRRVLFDHLLIIEAAARTIRDRYERRPDPDRLATDPFTLSQLRHLHEAVLGEPLLRDTFNRRMTPHLEAVRNERGPSLLTSGGRPAQLYERRNQSELSRSDRRRLLLPRAPQRSDFR